jgi:hypothetical protein
MQAGGQEEEHAASIHGLKWLQGGSGFGEAKNSGWRSAQSGGISEQFTLNMPVFADYNQRGNQVDYAYSFNGSVDGWATGTWGILRSYKGGEGNLFALPDNPVPSGIRMTNAKDFNMVCPKVAPDRDIDITAVSVNDIFGTRSDITVQDLYPNAHVGASPDSSGGTLVYNPREASVELGEESAHGLDFGVTEASGPLHDPTGIIYVNTADLVSAKGYAAGKGNDPYCWRAPTKGKKWKYDPSLPACKVRLRDGAPTEPVVIRAAAGDCMNVTLRNKVLAQAHDGNGNVLFQADGKPSYLDKRYKGIKIYVDDDKNGWDDDDLEATTAYFDQTTDLASGNALPAMVRRNRGDEGTTPTGMTSFNNNLMQPSAHVGLHPQLVEYDITRSDGANVGQNPADQAVAPGSRKTYQWYAGHIGLQVDTSGRKAQGTLEWTPIEFGGFNIMPTDKIKQGQKGLIGAGVIYPEGSDWVVDQGTNTAASVCAGSCILDQNGVPTNVAFRDFTTVASKGVSMFYKDSFPVENLLGEGSFGVAEDSQDMGHMNINYGNEAMWFRYGKNPTRVAGNADCNGDGAGGPCLGGLDNASEAFANTLIGGNPETPVFTADAGQPFRMHVLMPFSPGRGSTYDLHGHVWQRDPYVCENDADFGLPGKCDTGGDYGGLPTDGSVGSQSLGDNPVGFHLGAIESWFGTQHYEIVIDSAGGSNGIVGDYLFRDHMGLGNAGGLWGILRVGPTQ